ncbi:hypothetical protein PPYR_08602 [Photinus pyralis]|uniref:Uncharacterized protein n=1 Tax=Photinus pyralis TaxID=7054 RepID=A0A1Y1MQG1_PHOPY|nr:uncharacterized protein LOC116172044 isoform X3 [Photinus pyralis]KAB0797609.1 hypothetical protein PPYR_08602 [Photinus pyralis]
MTMEDCVIEVDDKSCCEELTDWHREVTLKLFGESGTTKICDNLDYALQEYNRILKKYETNRGIKQILKDRILDHVKTFHSFLPKCSIWTGASSYIETMQNVLIILCNLELEMATDIKISNSMEYSTKIMEITERIVYILPIYLLGDNVGICHVLLKLRPRFQSRQWKDIMRVIYRHFLVMAPVYDKSKENFCRNYLLFQNLKAITNKKDHPRIDALLYSKFGLTSDVLKTNQKIRRILRPLSNSIIDLVDMLTDHKQSPINNYFKYMAKKKKEKETPLSIYLGSESEEEEDVPHFVKQVPCRSRLQDSDAVILVDDDNIKTEASNSIICLDDDSDCEVTVSPSEEKCTRKKPPDLPLPSPGLSFLDLIAIPNKTISTLESPPYSIETERSPASDDQFQSAETNFDENELDKAQRMEETCTSADTITNEFLELSMPSTVEDKTENAEKESEAVETKESESHISSDSVAEIQTEAETDINDKSEENEPADIGPSSDTEQECTDNLDCTQNAEKCLPNGGYNLMHGLITPPKSDRTSDDVVTGAKNVYVPDIMRIDSICYDGFENLPLIAESSSYEDAAAEDNENKRHEESQSYENYESPENLEELQVELDQNLELPESINISDINLNAVCEDSSGDILADIVSTEEQSLDSSLFKSTPQTCVDDATKGPSANCDDLIDDTRTGGSKSDFHANLEPKQVIDKIIFTSSEKLSAPLALFSKFEQLQSELVENACSGPIEPMRILVNSAEHSNSNDSLGCAISPCRPFPENSPTSPPFEQINTRDYQIHLDRYLSSRKNGEVIRTEPHKTIITVPTDRKKKLGEVDEKEIKPHVPKKVRFDGLPLIENDILSEAKDSLARYKISKDDTKLVFLQPQVPIRIESMHELKEKEEVLKLRSKLYNSNNTDNKYTIKRVDYKQVNGTVISPPEIRHSVSNLIHNNLNSTVEGIPSGYTPAVNGYTSGFRYNYETTASNNASSHRNYVSGVPYSYDAMHTYIPSSLSRTVPRRGRGRPRRGFQYHPEGPT